MSPMQYIYSIIVPHETSKLLVYYFPLFTAVPQPMAVDSSSLLATQAPPDLLLGSEEGEKKASPTASVTDVTPSDPSTVENTLDSVKDSEEITEKDGVTCTDGGVEKKDETVEKGPPVESSTKNTDETDQTSASADSNAVETMETDTSQTDPGDGGDDKGAGDGEPSTSDDIGDGATSSETQQPPPPPPPVDDTIDTIDKDTAVSEGDGGGETKVEETAEGEQLSVQEGPPEEEEKGPGSGDDATEAPKEEDEAVVVSSSPRGEEDPVISEPTAMGDSVEGEVEGEGTTQEGEGVTQEGEGVTQEGEEEPQQQVWI